MKNVFAGFVLLSLIPVSSLAMYNSKVKCKVLDERLLNIVQVNNESVLRSGLGSGSVDFFTIADANGNKIDLNEALDQANALQDNGAASTSAQAITLKNKSQSLKAVLTLISGKVVQQETREGACAVEDSRRSVYAYSINFKQANNDASLMKKTIQVSCDQEGFNPLSDEACR